MTSLQTILKKKGHEPLKSKETIRAAHDVGKAFSLQVDPLLCNLEFIRYWPETGEKKPSFCLQEAAQAEEGKYFIYIKGK